MPNAVAAPEAPPAAARPLDVPRDTTPTWELELLVSGAVLFGLFQVPPLLHAVAARWSPHVGLIGLLVVAALNVLLASAVYALIACFVVHLALRAYWVALVGVNSVFPGGVRWEKMREMGPIQTQLNREMLRPLPDTISRVDNVASLVFAAGFVLAASLTTSVATLAVGGAAVWAASSVFGPQYAFWAMGLVMLPLMLVFIGAQVMDYKAGSRLDAAGRPARFVRRALRAALMSTPSGARAIASVLSTNLDRRVVTGALIGVSAVAAAAALVTGETDAEALPNAGEYRYFLDEGPGSALLSGQYAALRGDDPASRRAPWLDSDVATGPYVRLFIPYRTGVHNLALPRACPGLRSLDADVPDTPTARAAAAAVLACAARAHRVALDGRPLTDLRLRFFADPRANRRGFLAHIPVADLAAGEHVLTVWPVVRPDRPAPTAPYELPFWR